MVMRFGIVFKEEGGDTVVYRSKWKGNLPTNIVQCNSKFTMHPAEPKRDLKNIDELCVRVPAFGKIISLLNEREVATTGNRMALLDDEMLSLFQSLPETCEKEIDTDRCTWMRYWSKITSDIFGSVATFSVSER